MFQSSEPSLHSYRSPAIKIRRKIHDLVRIKSDGVFMISRGSGMSRTISMSKTIKITASKKKRMENGIRADRIGSNPHSNGDNFSRFLIIERMAVNIDTKYRMGGRMIARNDDIKISFILLEIDLQFSYD